MKNAHSYLKSALFAGLLIGIVGVFGFIVNAPWLFPSLGPTAYIIAERPDAVTARFYNIVMGHFLGIVVSFIVVIVIHFFIGALLHKNLLWQAFSATVSIVLLLVLMLVFRCTHPPAASTTLIIALGSYAPTPYNAFHFMMGVVTLAVAGEGAKLFLRERRT